MVSAPMSEASMSSGILVLDKPEGMTSPRVDAICKRALGARKVGHIGTLDPFATGLLLVAVNSGTKAIRYINCHTKIYEFEIKFGEKTNTGDKTGIVVEKSCKVPSVSEIQSVLPKFTGPILQKPHIFSAIKVNGRRAYEIARRGEIPPLESRVITVFELKIIEYARFRATVSSGTYIRTLAEDMAAAVGSCGHVTSLRRLADGKFSVKDAIRFDTLMESSDNGRDAMVSIENALDDIPVVLVSIHDARSLKFGRGIAVELDLTDGTYLAKASDGFLGIVKLEEMVLHLERLFIEGGS
jgi:tRNA pseudouridine55 synthase